MRRDSIFRGASITKPLTAALTMVLVEEGRLDLDAPVDDLLPELAEPRVLRALDSQLDDTVAADRPITARHLLTGTAGHGFSTWESAVQPLLMEQLGQASMDPRGPGARRVDAPAVEIPLMHQPGEGWTYNASYDVLAVLPARAAGQDFADLMADDCSTHWAWATPASTCLADKLDRMTTLYEHDDSGLKVTDEPDGTFAEEPAFASGSGGLVTTVDDWLAFGRMLLAGGGDVLGPESVRLMTSDHMTPQHREMGGFFLDGQGWGFGGGVDTSLIDPWNVVGRYGWVGGTGTSAYVHPYSGTVAVLLTQVGLGGDAMELLQTFWTSTRTAGDTPATSP